MPDNTTIDPPSSQNKINRIDPPAQELKSDLRISSEDKRSQLETKMKSIAQDELEELLKAKAARTGLGYVNLKGVAIPSEYLKIIDEQDARQHQALCFYYSEHKEMRLCCVNPDDGWLAELITKLSQQYGAQIKLYLTSQHSFEFAVAQYVKIPKIKQMGEKVEITAEDLKQFSAQISRLQDLQDKIEGVSLSQLVSLLVSTGLKTGASDIHVEAEEHDIKVRYRIDGILHTAANISKDKWKQLISRVKLLSGLKINIEKEPQDGRFDIELENDRVSVRVSTLPTAFGESVVMRLLRSKSIGLQFEDLGLRGDNFELLSKEIHKPNGMIVVTGPTGSGKTTTLYAVLNKLNSEETKILTIEDPIEYELQGVNQSQINPSRDYTFAKGLRSLVRQDPDIIMVGEMRDLETVEIALNAALTGHLVLSTLHTNDAAGAIPRFLAMGAKPYLLAPSLNAIIAQRLVRKLCACKKTAKLTKELEEHVNKTLSTLPESIKVAVDLSNPFFYDSQGCDKCNGLGYSGRLGIFEIFPVDADMERLILSGAISEYEVNDFMKQKGILSMAQDGLLKAFEGITSVKEVFRVAD